MFPKKLLPQMVEPEILFEPFNAPYKVCATTTFVLRLLYEKYEFAPIDIRLCGFEFPIPTFPDVIKDANCTVFDVVFPVFTT
jgi:hypothetical protein